MRLKKFIKENYLFTVGFCFNCLLFLIFTTYGLQDAITGHDLYIPGIVLLVTIACLLHFLNFFILKQKDNQKRDYVIGYILNGVLSLTLLGIVSAAFTIVNLLQKQKQLKFKYQIMYLFCPIAISLMGAGPFIYLSGIINESEISYKNISVGYNEKYISPGHKFETDAEGHVKITGENWMGALYDFDNPDGDPQYKNVQRLCDINIPSTHDSLAYHTQEIPGTKWAIQTGNFNQGGSQTQAYSLLEQLNAGVRSFDFRGKGKVYDGFEGYDTNPEHGSFYAIHDYSGVIENGDLLDIRDVYYQICLWLKTHDTEFLILSNTTKGPNENNEINDPPPPNVSNFLSNYFDNHFASEQIAALNGGDGGPRGEGEESKSLMNYKCGVLAFPNSAGRLDLERVRGRFAMDSTLGFQYDPRGTQIFKDGLHGNTLMGSGNRKGKQINRNFSIVKAHYDDPIPQGQYTIKYFRQSLAITGGDLINLRNNPMKAAKRLNNKFIGRMRLYQLDDSGIPYIGGYTFDTAPGDFAPNHNIAAAVYMMNFWLTDYSIPT